MDTKAMFNISYGLYVLTTKDDSKDNGCIINTLSQVTSEPNRISITVNKSNYTCDMILKTGKFNVSILSEAAVFDVFKNFGFQSGKDADKFDNFKNTERADNGILRLNSDYANAFVSCEVFTTIDLGSHIMFLAEVTDAKVISDVPSVTYTYYHKHIKPQPQKAKKGGWRCTICGYIYEGDELPSDFICPICKHGAEVFERIEEL